MSDKSRDELLREFEAAIKSMGLGELRGLAKGLMSGELLDVRARPGRSQEPRPSFRKPRRDDVVVYQVRADLDGAKPLIWRRLADLTLNVVHQVLQDSFGWTDPTCTASHSAGGVWDRDAEVFLCAQEVEDPQDDVDENGTFDRDVRLDEVLAEPGDRLAYVYDYGDDWQVTLRLEQVSSAEPDATAAVCTGGRMAAPPDDSRFEYLDGGLAAIVDEPEHFDRGARLGQPERALVHARRSFAVRA